MLRIEPHQIDLTGRDVEEYLWQVRFWSKIDRSGGDDACWNWQGAVKKDSGHGITARHGRNRKGDTKLAHRIAYTLLVCDPGWLACCHRCDNPRCCNPAHIFLGTQADNMADMHRKGRGKGPPKNSFVPEARRGEKHHGAKLTEAQVIEIKRLRSEGETNTSIAKSFGVSSSTIGLIANGKIWNHIRSVTP